MSEKLIIRNFGPIKDMSFDFKKINILIGDQGTGKSIVAKLLIAIKNCIFLSLFDLPEDSLSQFYGHLDLVGIKNFIKKESVLIYSNGDYSFKIEREQVTINKNVSFEESAHFNFTYIPAERNMVSVLADSLYALLEVKAELPKLFLRFGNKYQSSRKLKSEFKYEDILGVNFTHRNNKDYILIPGGIEIDFADASSGIQGCVALLTVLDSVMTLGPVSRSMTHLFDKNLRLLVIEEPELNCFPKTQNELLKYIIRSNKIFKTLPEEEYEVGLKNEIVITTHSPYILTSLNNLMYAYEVGQKEPEEANKVIDKKYWINPSDVSAYRLLANGKCENIISSDEDGTLIRAEKIDEISGVLNEQFDALLNIELVKK